MNKKATNHELYKLSIGMIVNIIIAVFFSTELWKLAKPKFGEAVFYNISTFITVFTPILIYRLYNYIANWIYEKEERDLLKNLSTEDIENSNVEDKDLILNKMDVKKRDLEKLKQNMRNKSNL